MRFATVVALFTAPFLVSAVPTKVKRASPNDKLVLSAYQSQSQSFQMLVLFLIVLFFSFGL